MSFFVMRLREPVPVTCEKSTAWSSASLRTSGERIWLRGPPPIGGATGSRTSTGSSDSISARPGSSWAISSFSSGGGAAFGRAASGSSIKASSVPTATVSPSLTRIRTSTPSSGEGTSVSTLSVEISNSSSSRATCSPSFFNHLMIVPSMTVSPICGMVTDVVIRPPLSPRCELFHRLDHVGRLRQERVLEGGGEGHRHVRRRQAHHRRVEVLERLLRDLRCHFGADPEEPVALVQYQRAPRLLDRSQHGLGVHRIHGPKIDDLDRDTAVRQLFGGLERAMHHPAVGDDRNVVAFARHIRLADRHEEVGVLGNDLLHPAVDPLLLEEHARVVVADGRLQQALRVGRKRGG